MSTLQALPAGGGAGQPAALQAARRVNKPRGWRRELEPYRSSEPSESRACQLRGARRASQHRNSAWRSCRTSSGTGEAAEAARTKAIEECNGAVPVPSKPPGRDPHPLAAAEEHPRPGIGKAHRLRRAWGTAQPRSSPPESGLGGHRRNTLRGTDHS